MTQSLVSAASTLRPAGLSGRPSSSTELSYQPLLPTALTIFRRAPTCPRHARWRCCPLHTHVHPCPAWRPRSRGLCLSREAALRGSASYRRHGGWYLCWGRSSERSLCVTCPGTALPRRRFQQQEPPVPCCAAPVVRASQGTMTPPP
jgi:hypothetical protein